jgi:hypothetical protein
VCSILEDSVKDALLVQFSDGSGVERKQTRRELREKVKDGRYLERKRKTRTIGRGHF